MLRKLNILVIVCALFAVGAVALAAQPAAPKSSSQVVVVGPVDLNQGVIMVDGYIIAPSSAFQPAFLHQGDDVIVIGILLPDGATIQATSLELFDGSTPEATEEPTAQVTPPSTPEATPPSTPEATEESTPEATACNPPNQPVAQQLATAFGVSYAEIMGWHCKGFGFGEIARAYLLANETGAPAATYFAEHQAGMGWGQIVKQVGTHPSDLAPGQVIHPGGSATEAPNGPGNGHAHGNGNGNGQGNSNHGHGNGHGGGHP